jgi:protein O-GlcNAc transferase
MDAQSRYGEIAALSRERRLDVALERCAEALEAFPTDRRFLEAKAIILRRAGRLTETAAYLESLLPEQDAEAWVHLQLGAALTDRDRPKALRHFRRAFALEPDNINARLALAETLERSGDGEELEEAYQLARPALANLSALNAGHLKVLHDIFQHVCAFDELAALGDPRDLGRLWANTGRHTALFRLLSRIGG